jgi:hypothetical protein
MDEEKNERDDKKGIMAKQDKKVRQRENERKKKKMTDKRTIIRRGKR